VPRLPIANPLLDNFGDFDPVNLVNPYSFSAPAAETAFVVSSTGGASVASADTSAQYGYKFTVGGAGITITQVGIQRVTGAYQDFTVNIFSSDGTTELASATVDFDAVAVGSVSYTTLGSPLSVSASAVRHIRVLNTLFNEFRGYSGSAHTLLTTTAAATINSASDENGAATGKDAYVDFKYTSP
jgi:hypothetical protein